MDQRTLDNKDGNFEIRRRKRGKKKQETSYVKKCFNLKLKIFGQTYFWKCEIPKMWDGDDLKVVFFSKIKVPNEII